MKSLFPLIACAMLLLVSCNTSSENNKNQWQITSPDHALSVELSLNSSGQLIYSAKNQDEVVLEKSPLGLIFAQASFDSSLTYVSSAINEGQEEVYTLFSGKKTDISAPYNQLNLTLQNSSKEEISLKFRIFNDGFAFRYEMNDEVGPTLTLTKELTGFNLPAEGKAWMHPYDSVSDWAPAYETFYENGIAIGTEADASKNGWGFPLLFHASGNWTLITAADVKRNFPAMHVLTEGIEGLYRVTLPVYNEAKDVCVAEAELNTPFETPWKVVITSENIAGVVESNLVTHVSSKNVLGDTDWIEPGISSWSWWSISESPRNFETLKKFVDFTAEMGWPYFLVDANWNEMEGGNLEQLISHANSKDVGILLWYNSGGPHNVVTEQPRNIMNVDSLRKQEFKKLQEWGVRGVKVDFFQSDKPCIINLYHDILEDAAEHEILVNFHGATLPWGWRRTYPNLMTVEAVKGAEVYKFGKEYPDYAAKHNTILVFTRNIVGPMDYTPVTFSDVTYPHKTTNAHELALAVVFESGIQHFADHYNSYLEQPGYVIDYLKDIPVVWDETRLIDGYPGEFAVVARRKGDTWYVSGINGTGTKKHVSMPFDFLTEGDFQVEIIKDGAESRSFIREKMEISSGQAIDVEMLPEGGFAAMINKP